MANYCGVAEEAETWDEENRHGLDNDGLASVTRIPSNLLGSIMGCQARRIGRGVKCIHQNHRISPDYLYF